MFKTYFLSLGKFSRHLRSKKGLNIYKCCSMTPLYKSYYYGPWLIFLKTVKRSDLEILYRFCFS